MPPPAFTALVPRPSLVAALRTSLENADLTAIVAPAGYGKTSLLTLALGEDPQCAWYTAQLWHADGFAEPLVREVRRLRPDFGRLTLALASRRPESGPAGAAWAQRLGATFAEELAHIDAPIRVVFDDVHLLEGDVAFGEFITGLMRTLPRHVRLVLSGRTLPQLPLAEWLVQKRAALIGVDQLRFGDNEIVALAELRGHGIPAPQAGILRTTFEGWAAGIALSVAGGDVTLPTRDGVRTASTALLIDANLAALDVEMVRFLETTAVFETLHASLLERDADLGDVRRYLHEFERRGVMLSVVRPTEIYRVHPLLREALIERVRAREGGAAVGRHHAWAGELLESNGLDLPALFHFEQSGDDARLAHFVQAHAYELFIAGLGERAGRIVHALKERGVRAPIAYGLVEGMLLRQRGEPGVAERVNEAIAGARSAHDSSAEIALRFVLIEDQLARRESLNPAESAQLREIARAAGGTVAVAAHTFAGWSHVLNGDFADARASARAAFAQAGDDLVSRVRVASLDAYSTIALGEIEEADALMAQMLHALEPSDHVVLMANTLVWYARFALLWGDVAAAKDYAEKGRELGRRLELPAELAGVELALAEVYAHEGALAACESAARAARSFGASAWYAGDRERAPALAALFVARAQLKNGGAALAREAARAALTETSPPPAQRIVILAESAAYAAIAGDAEGERLAALAEAELPAVRAIDALDALGLLGAHSLLRKLRARSGRETSAPALPQALTKTFSRLLARRSDLLLEDRQALLGHGPRFETFLLEALEPGDTPSASRKPAEPRGAALTKRETEILEFLAEGLTNKEIAQRFSLSPRTVDTHVERVLSKLNATTRTRAVAAAIRAGLVTTP